MTLFELRVFEHIPIFLKEIKGIKDAIKELTEAVREFKKPEEPMVSIEKACEWLECNAAYYLNSISALDNPTSSSTPRYIGAWLETDKLIEDFKKATEGMYNIKSK